MFARPPSAVPVAPPIEGGAAAWKRLLANPVAGAAAAGTLCLASAAMLVLVAGNPHAGAPSFRANLATTPAAAPGALRGTLTPDPTATTPLDLQASAAGQAVITLPQGGSGPAPAAPADLNVEPAPAAAPTSPPLPKAPIAGLTAPGPGGLLPIIAKDGRTPFTAYARPFTPNGKPKIALVIGGLGLNAAATKAAIERLPPEVTLSFVPYADALQAQIDLARQWGHEVVLEIPMEPLDYPNNDPGPYTLLANGSGPDTARRLEWLLSRGVGYFAVTNYLGGKFLGSDAAMGNFTAALKSRGLGFIDDGSARGRAMGGGAPRASADAMIDQDLSAVTIDRQLSALEGHATGHGQALGAGFAYPVTVQSVTRWASGLAARGYQLAPASALARR